MSGALLDVLFPPRCLACDAVLGPERFFCEGCAPLVLDTPDARCERCSEPGRFESGRCARCRASPPNFTHAWAPFEHDGAVAKAIHRYKYEGHAELAEPLAALLASRATKVLPRLEGPLCPIPLHAKRFRERGYDQTTLLAVALSKVLRRPLHDEWLTRTRETKQQVGLSELEREENLRGAFLASQTVKGEAVVLVDDVFTTGATAREATAALLGAGARSVSVLTIARAKRELA